MRAGRIDAGLLTDCIQSIIAIHRSHAMRIADHVKPISYLKSEAAQIVKDLAESGEPLIITQNGEAKLVVQDARSYEAGRQTSVSTAAEAN